MKYFSIFLIFILCACASLTQVKTLIYENDFEEGVENSTILNRIKSNGLSNSQYLSFQYSKGNEENRYARVVRDPLDENNNVLDMNISSKGLEARQRVQASFSSVPNLKEMRQTVRVFFSPDMEYLTQYQNAFTWLILAEWWNSAPKDWNTPNVYRVSLRAVKAEGDNKSLHFKVDAQSVTYSKQRPSVGTGAIFKTEWEKSNKKFIIPYGKWLTFEYHIKAGDNRNGLFYMAVTPDGGKKQVIFNLKGATQSLNYKNQQSYNFWSPMKLYTSDEISDFMFKNKKSLQVYFDDLKVWRLITKR
ncbi:hypothetical protein LZF95_03355 [Algoriphagus sp. AGSA1]|uniref:hypothetical protein n=1 Tax=Algoriphagus sp. AGSA1 TaxID=2907213 RepID=UPI001F3FCB95|nr:hypothetical protein [Algoriphagus sp. AGSA1]MCE7053701.1 hypothetical protein [Algoriphagus sp. AGSA1]